MCWHILSPFISLQCIYDKKPFLTLLYKGAFLSSLLDGLMMLGEKGTAQCAGTDDM